jgi:NhaA family Na+:H+ antiporter
MIAPTSRPRLRDTLREFLSSQAGSGMLLLAVAAAAMVVANSALGPAYFAGLETKVAGLSVLHWINDALMALFFLLVGLEIKREFVAGELSTWSRRALPGIAAFGGMAMPALVYLAFNLGPDGAPRGWAVPAATDIAFALGVLALLGSRAPPALKIFLTALAIIDDLGAVIIIALFYTAQLNLAALAGAGLVLALLFAMNAYGVRRLLPYLVLGALLWFLTLKSGVHATVAGVALALAIPLGGNEGEEESPLTKLEHALAMPVAMIVVPIFGFANAGISLSGFTPASLGDPVTLGVMLGLFLGKQLGVFAFAAGAIRLHLSPMPEGVSWAQLYGVSVLCGIGFTMSLFIALLAFASAPHLLDETKVGVIAGSILSGLVGAALLAATGRPRRGLS